MISGVIFEIVIVQTISWADDECRSELAGAASNGVLAVAGPQGSRSGGPSAYFGESPDSQRLGADDLGSGTVLVQQHRKRNGFVLDEGLGVASPSGADRGDVGPGREDLFVPLPDLTGPLPAGQSTKMPEKQHHLGPLRPMVTESGGLPVRID